MACSLSGHITEPEKFGKVLGKKDIAHIGT